MVYQNCRVITLDNGIRVAMLPARNTRLVHCGVMIRAGSRDETKTNNGVAHLIEHTVFKGTRKRKSYHILNRIESVGGDLNAYTSREKTCYLVTCLTDYAGRAFDLLSDITFHATFPDKEIDRERKVIMEEFEMFRDSPEDAIADDFLAKMYPDHPLGFDILGTRENLGKLNREDILHFLGKHYGGQNMVLSIAGNMPLHRMEYYARKHFDVPLPERKAAKRLPAPEPGFFRDSEVRDFSQDHIMIGCPAPGRHDPGKYGMLLINNLLGGTGMSARLNMEIREKRGYAYNIWTHYSTFDDTGLFGVYLGTEVANVEKSINLVIRELKKLRDKPLSDRQLSVIKRQIKGHTAMAVENYSSIMQAMARNLLDYGRVVPIDEFFSGIESVTANEIAAIAERYLNEDDIRILRFEQEK